MPLIGLHVVQGYARSFGSTDILGEWIWSETLAAPGATVRVVEDGFVGGMAGFELICSVNAWVSIGPDPDPVAGSRTYLEAMVPRVFVAKAGDKVAWGAA